MALIFHELVHPHEVSRQVSALRPSEAIPQFFKQTGLSAAAGKKNKLPEAEVLARAVAIQQ